MQGTPEHRWKSWIQQARDLLGKEESDILSLSYLKDDSIDQVNILRVADRSVKEADLCTLLPLAWWEDEKFRRSLLWRISKLRGNGKKCVQQLDQFGFEFDGEHVSDGACRESELCVCIFSVLARLPGHQIESLKENLARLRPINAENVDSCTLLFKMMFSAGILTTSNLDELRESLQRIGASRKSIRPLKKYCEKYSLPWTGYEQGQEEITKTTVLRRGSTDVELEITVHGGNTDTDSSSSSSDSENGVHDPSQPDRPKPCGFSSYRKCCLKICSLAICTVFVVCAVVGIVILRLELTQSTSQAPFLLLSNTTAIVDQVDSLYFSGWSAREEQATNREVSLFVVRYDALTKHIATRAHSSMQYDQDHPKRDSGRISPQVFLLRDSTIKYTFCAVSFNSSESQQGTVFVFDNPVRYHEYENETLDGYLASIDHWIVNIGSVSEKWLCITRTFTVEKESYFILAADTPGGISFTYSYTIHSVYLDQADYQAVCTVTYDKDCPDDARISQGRLDDHKKYVLLAYAKPPTYASESNYTCVDVTRKMNKYRLKLLYFGVSSLGIIAVVLISLVFCVICCAVYRVLVCFCKPPYSRLD